MIRAILFLALAAAASAQELTPQVLQKVKAATVYIEASTGTGSGFLFRKSGSSGYVMTCAHVVGTDREVWLSFDAGTPRERRVRGRVTGSDGDLDLACVLVEGVKDLPEVLATATRTEVRDGEAIYAAGYPFGADLAARSGRPEVTLTVAKVAAVRRDREGTVQLVELLGEVNPGNSGGPVTDARGKVIGVAALKKMGTQTAWAVPGEGMKQFLLGTALLVEFTQSDRTATTVKASVRVVLADPVGAMRSAGIAWGRMERIDETNEPRESGGWRKISATMKESALKIDDRMGSAMGTIDLSRTREGPSRERVIYQIWWIQGDGTRVWSQPMATTLSFQETDADRVIKPPQRLPRSLAPVTSGPAAGARLEPSHRGPGARSWHGLSWSRATGKLYVLDATRGRLVRLTPGTLAVEAELDLGWDVAALALSPDGTRAWVASRRVKVVPESGRVTQEGRLLTVDLAKFEKTGTLDVAVDPWEISGVDEGLLYISGPQALTLVDAAGGRTLFSWSGYEPGAHLRFHPDQGRLYLGSRTGESRRHSCVRPELRVDGRVPAHTGWNPEELPLGGMLEISPDGKWLVSMYGGVSRLSLAPVLDINPEKTLCPWSAFAFPPDGKSAWGASIDGTLRRYSVPGFEARKPWILPGICSRLVVDPSGKVLYAVLHPAPNGDATLPVTEWIRGRTWPDGEIVAIPIPD